MNPPKFLQLLFFYAIVLFGLLTYSYAHVDLNLTLSSNVYYQQFQSQLTRLGYFERPASSIFFVLLLCFLFGFYLYILRQINARKLYTKQVWTLVGLTTILVFSYPAFSHDFFNYMFDARIMTTYHLSPYFFKALDFPFDEWVRFMHWTHRYFPYGPGWLLLTIIPSWIGAGKFVLTLLLFKLLFLFFHLLNCLFLSKISQKIAPQNTAFIVTFYGLNPLILLESLVSSHNEVMMLSFVLLSTYLLMKSKWAFSIVSLLFSIGIKFVSFVLLPLIFIRKKIDATFFTYASLLWAGILIPVIIQRELYAWYLIPIIGFAALSNQIIRIVIVGFSLGALARYTPFLLYGDYSPQTILLQNGVFIVITLISMSVYYLTVERQRA